MVQIAGRAVPVETIIDIDTVQFSVNSIRPPPSQGQAAGGM
jgi:hypothetical protein